MNQPWRPAVLILLASLLCSPLLAYQLALKDGRTLPFQKHRVEAGKFIYTDEAGKEVSVALSDVDLERTKALNANETPPLDLSPIATTAGLSAGNSATGKAANSADPPSLADAARAMREEGKTHPAAANRKYTSDDMPSSGEGVRMLEAAAEEKKADAGVETHRDEPRQRRSPLTEQEISEFYDFGREETARNIFAYAGLPPDTAFPDRAEWEFRLFEAKQDMVHAAMRAREHPQDETEQDLFTEKWNRYVDIANEGIGKACATISGCKVRHRK